MTSQGPFQPYFLFISIFFFLAWIWKGSSMHFPFAMDGQISVYKIQMGCCCEERFIQIEIIVREILIKNII